MPSPGPNPRAVPRARIGLRSFAPALVIGLVIGLVLAVALPPTSPDGSGHWQGANAWSNGVVAIYPFSDHPAVTVSTAAAGVDYGLYAGVSQVRELTPTGLLVASAYLDRSWWPLSNVSSPTG
jgi:hypothetical protein